MLAMAGGTDQEIDGLQASQSGVAIGGLPVPLFWDVPRRELPACDPMNRGLLTRPAARAVAPAPQRHRVWRTLAKAADASANSEACYGHVALEQAVVQLEADNERLKAENEKLKEDIEKLQAEKLKAEKRKAERDKQSAETNIHNEPGTLFRSMDAVARPVHGSVATATQRMRRYAPAAKAAKRPNVEELKKEIKGLTKEQRRERLEALKAHYRAEANKELFKVVCGFIVVVETLAHGSQVKAAVLAELAKMFHW